MMLAGGAQWRNRITAPAPPPGVPPPSQKFLLLFWAPLAAQWIMMALEGPFLAAIIARMGEPTFNLAAYGVAFAFAILVESPVIMLMSAATALVEDATSYRRLRNFANALNVGSTLLLLVVLVPRVFDLLMTTLLDLPAEVSGRVYGALWLLLPWPAAIGYRRFLHGVLIRAALTRRVAYGTILRLAAMAGTAVTLYFFTSWHGAWVGAASLSAGVVVEAAAARWMAAGAVRDRLADDGRGDAPGYREIGRFYYPLALTSLLALTVHPMLTFFMGRAPSPVESLAVFPVVHALSFLFRSAAFAFQETVIALIGRGMENVQPLLRFGVLLAIGASGTLALVAFTPLVYVWFERISGLPPELAAVAVIPSRIAVLMPAVAMLLSFQQAVLVKARTTRPVTIATGAEVVAIALLFTLLGWGVGWVGATAAMLALVGGRIIGTVVLAVPVLRAVRQPQPPITEAGRTGNA
jgi:progressive ankylosis protein